MRCQAPQDQLTSPDLWKAGSVPFSFKYASQDSAKFLTSWETKREVTSLKTGRILYYSYADPVTHLKVTAEVRLYSDFPNVVDWVLHFRNDGASDTPIIEDILPLDWAVTAAPGKVVVRHAQGSDAHAEDFTPLVEQLDPGGTTILSLNGEDLRADNRYPFSTYRLATTDLLRRLVGQGIGRPTSLI